MHVHENKACEVCVTLYRQLARMDRCHDHIYITTPPPARSHPQYLDLFRSRFFLTEPNLAAKRKKYLALETITRLSLLAPFLPLHLGPSPWLRWPVSHTPLSNARLVTSDVSSFHHGFHSARCVYASTETVRTWVSTQRSPGFDLLLIVTSFAFVVGWTFRDIAIYAFGIMW
jgi:hypothetical protein